ncbi:MAG: hypothetical protein WC824_08820 [Bacteroidota bacterium]|jgi:hypothetical protein
MNESPPTPTLNIVDGLFAAGDPTLTELIAPRKQLKEESAPLQKKYEDLTNQLGDSSLPDDDREMLEIERLVVETELIPYTVRLERISEYVNEMKVVKGVQLAIARTTAEYTDPRKVASEKTKLLTVAEDLATRTRNGLASNSAWQTKLKYAPVRNQFEELVRATDSDRARELAAEILGLLKPVLLAKVSAHADVKIELCDAFISAAKKS